MVLRGVIDCIAQSIFVVCLVFTECMVMWTLHCYCVHGADGGWLRTPIAFIALMEVGSVHRWSSEPCLYMQGTTKPRELMGARDSCAKYIHDVHGEH